jgi:radical SAM superfamily enzyme YgiQ (UPF0313 family)
LRIVLVSPPFGKKGRQAPVAPVAPPALEYLAGMTRQVAPGVELELVDANVDRLDLDAIRADLVGFTLHTVQAPWVYETAGALRRRGVPVVLGGTHVTALPEEAAAHADALVLGEAESVWSSLLADLERGRLAPRYQGQQAPLERLPWPETGLLHGKYAMGSFFTARGCPHDCSFCSVQSVYGGKVRFRPIGEVVAELAASERKMFWNLDDNCWGTSVPRSIELFREVARNVRRKQWFGMGDLVTLDHARGEELLRWAQESGLAQVRVGWESNDPRTLEAYHAATKQGRCRQDAIKKIRAAGIDVMLFVIVGSRRDTLEDFEGVIELSRELDVTVRPVMLTPHPRTALYQEYEPYLLEHDWERYDGYHAVFEHPTLSPLEREKALTRIWLETFKLRDIIRRLTRISVKGFPSTHLASFMIQYFESKAYRRPGALNGLP